MKYELLTGATGLLGGYLLRDALREGRRVAVLARSTRWMCVQERIHTLLARLGSEQTPVILEGNLHQPGLGLSQESRDWVGENCDRLVHCGAALQFLGDRTGEPYRSNVDGTRHALGLCQESGIKEFHLVSTAYVCGNRRGSIREDDFECGQTFSNDYERSKFVSEMLVRQSDCLERWFIYRPSVIVGDYHTGFTSTFTGVYSLLRLAWLFSGADLGAVMGALGMSGGDGLNLVSVDWVSAVMRHLMVHGRNRTTYHLTSPLPVKPIELYAAAGRALARPPEVPSSALDEALQLYRPYLGEHPHFDSSFTQRDAQGLPCPPMDADALDRLVSYASDRGFEMPPEWNLRARMEALRSESSEPAALALEVEGPEGGLWSLAGGADRIAVRPGGVEGAVRAYCNPVTLEDLVASKLSLEGAVFSGLMVLEGKPSQMDPCLELLERFLSELREARVGR